MNKFFNILPNIWSVKNGIVYDTTKEWVVAYYKFNGNANDSSGNWYNGTVTGATLTTDQFWNANSAYSFVNNTDQILSTAITGVFTQTWTYTVSCWLKQTSPWVNRFVWSFQWGSSNRIALVSHTNDFSFNRYNWTSYTSSSLAGWVSLWARIHLVCRSDWWTLKLFKNGVAAAWTSQIYAQWQSGNVISIWYPGATTNWAWSIAWNIDNVKVRNRALSDAEILALYNQEK